MREVLSGNFCREIAGVVEYIISAIMGICCFPESSGAVIEFKWVEVTK